jgi:hypothetical protein
MQNQWLTVDRKQQFALKPGRRISCRNDCNNILLVIVSVLLHGILDYPGFGQIATSRGENLEVAVILAKLCSWKS